MKHSPVKTGVGQFSFDETISGLEILSSGQRPKLTMLLSWCLSFKWVLPFFTLSINSVRSLLFEHSKETDDFESTLQNDYVHDFTTKIRRKLVMRRRKG